MTQLEFEEIFDDRTNPACFWGTVQVGPAFVHFMAVAVVRDKVPLEALAFEYQHWLDNLMDLDEGERERYHLVPYRWRSDAHDYRRHYFIFAIPFQGVCA